MFSKKEKPKRNHAGKSLSQYGLFEVPSDFDTGLGNEDDDDDDEDLEAELAALAGGGGASKPKRPPRKIIPQRELDSMVSESMKDVDDDDVSIDENDPELLSELNDIVGEDEPEEDSSPSQEAPPPASSSDIVNILVERLKNYEICEVKAKESGETTKARRYGRAIKTLKDLIKRAKSGSPIDLNDDSIPPDIHPSTAAPARPAPPVPQRPTPPEPLSPTTTDSPQEPPTEDLVSIQPEAPAYDQEKLNTLLQGQKQYKVAALKAKHEGNAQKAVLFLKVSKQFDIVIGALKSGQPVDLSDMPGPPETFSMPEPPTQESEVQQNSPAPAEEEPAAAPPALITASSTMEALQQRLGLYKEQEAKAKEENNSSKARRYGRIIKQFEQAIKANKAGKPFAYEELPTPPGYGPIPGVQQPAAEPADPAPAAPPRRPAPQPSNSGESKPSLPSPESKPARMIPKQTQADKQMVILVAKQKQFKLAALEAKKRGEMAQAKEFLRQAKGFDKLIEASIAGLPVDWSSIPVSPEAKSQLDNEYDIAMSAESDDSAGIDGDLFARLETQLQKQLKMCLTTRDHNKAIGDVAGMNRFERFALNVTKDMDVVRAARKEGRIPKFHYETKEFAIVKCCPEIEDNQMEVTVHRGLNISTDKDIDTYVKMEFPFPQETPYNDRTSTMKNTNNPDFQKTFVVPIQRNSRVCQRTFKRHSLKFELFSKGGFFRSDALVGTVNLKLQPLETQCEIHDTFDLLEGRKKVGGKLEIQVKLRTPIQTQQVEQIQERWLVVDQ
ncbi:coiled-coil and C2 domain-containing protein 1-like isoform X2 [Diabrotica virgifera virgifera]|uniref:Coiled-coil and C2 domain-containing protein 1-like isoform X2 n=1 Tax=Diabrotica virgifera virgifera TaxID=50390 RepID=A0A6P7F2Z0_DIAVI|nr:coiled-coil and C2 domain-containing protein 1-like isoform X2 [Diabrotica virgifera virgifera]